MKKSVLYGNKYLLGAWNNMMSRCHYHTDPGSKYYAKKGIKVAITKDELLSIWNRDNGHLLKQPSLDRIDPLDNYTALNCRFIEMHENRMRVHTKNT